MAQLPREAQSLLPVLESLLKRAIEGKRAAEEAEAGLQELSRQIYFAGGMRVDVAAAQSERDVLDGDETQKRLGQSLCFEDDVRTGQRRTPIFAAATSCRLNSVWSATVHRVGRMAEGGPLF